MNMLYLTHPLNGILMIVLGFGLGAYLTRRLHMDWGLWWIGAAGFVLSQVGHIPFNIGLSALFQRGVLPTPEPGWRLMFNAVVLGLSAGLWEELTRYGVYRWWAKEARSWRRGALLGAGHGGMEAILLGVLVLYTFLQMAALGGPDQAAHLPSSLNVEQLQQLRAAIQVYWSAPALFPLLGALERSFTLVVQTSLSVIVLQAFLRRQSRWLWLAVAWHAAVDALGYSINQLWGPLAAEAAIGVTALLSLGMIFALRSPEPEPPEAAPMPDGEVKTAANLDEVEITSANLEQTRYN